RGQTGPDDSAAIAVALSIYAIGLPAFVLQKLLQPLYFARSDTKSPFRFAVWAMIVNAVLAFGLAPWIEWLAPAIAATISAWIMIAQLGWGARKFGDTAKFDSRLRKRLWRIVASSIVMGAALWFLWIMLIPWLGSPGWRYLALAVLITLGSLIYFAVARLTGAFGMSDLREASRRSP
ncbi:MAG: lipid II flippase MurJ, partial [Shimia sp.]|nr:lipid II flippase MurJ [Shimia sp.]